MLQKLSISIIFLFVISFAKAQINVQFTSDKQSGCLPLLVNFINNSTPSDNATYKWSFGNGNYSTLKNPQAAYIQAGNYTISLIVTFENESDTLILKDFITVFPKPIANFTTKTENNGCVPLRVEFMDLTNSQTPIIEHIWDFGDGKMSFDVNPQTTYEKTGFHTVSLRVVDENGCESSTFKNNIIKVVEKPNVEFSSLPNFNCKAPSSIEFLNETTDNYTVSYDWSFGDGTNSTDISPNHIFQNNGTYDVQLIAKNEHNCSDTLLKTEYVKIGDVNSDFIISNTKFCKNDSIKFINKSINATEYYWNFGDGSSSVEENPIHIYPNSGNYVVSLTAKNGINCIETFSKTVSIDYLKANFTVDKNFSCSDSIIVNFTDLSENATEWEWHFGNGKTSTHKNNRTTYYSDGYFHIEFADTLIITNINGCKDFLVKEKNIIISIPNALCTPNNTYLYNNQTKGCFPLNVNFQDQSTYNSSNDYIVSRMWDFGDGSTTANATNISHEYKNVGEYDAKFTVTTNLGCSTSFDVKVLVGNKQNPDFIVEGIDSMCANYEFHFRSKSSDENLIDEYFWTFSDKSYDFIKDVNHSFLDTGYCSASLSVGYNGCWSDIKTIEKIVYTTGALGTFTAIKNCENPLSINFNDNIIDATKWYWNWGDNQTDHSMTNSPSHIYEKSGDYIVTLVSLNENNDCMFVQEQSIRVRSVDSKIKTDKVVGCVGLELNLNPNDSKDIFPNFYFEGKNYNFKWIFPETNETEYSNSIQKHSFNKVGKNTVQLIITDMNGCLDTSSLSIIIYDVKSNFDVDLKTACAPFNVQFSNQSVADTTIQSYSWNFGDKLISQEINPKHNYTKKDNYDVTLITTDVLNCKDTLVFTDFIDIRKPQPQISISKQEICVGETLNFNETQEITMNHFWDFGNGKTSTLANADNTYLNNGIFDISLKVTDELGCDSTTIFNNFIDVHNYPTVDFVTDTTYSDCYPFLVKFSAITESFDSLNFQWDFGDGKTSEIENPTHSYTIPGDFNIKLKVQNNIACADSIEKPKYIHVGGPYAEIIKSETICKGVEYPFTLKNQMNIFNFKWDMGDGTIKFGDTITHSYQQYGTIYHSIILFSDTLSTCDITIQDSIEINPIIAGFTNSDIGNCINYPINFNNISIGNEKNSWFFNDFFTDEINPIYSFANSGNNHIKFIAEGVDGCKDSAEKEIMIFPLPEIISFGDTMLCDGSEIQLIAKGAVNYAWFADNDSIFENSPFVKPNSSTTFGVVGTDEHFCKNTDSTYVFVQRIPQLFATSDTSIIIGEFVTLHASSDQIVNYEWTSNAEISCLKCQNPQTQILDDYEFQIEISDTNSCFTVTKEFEVKIRKEYSLDLPTLFTPNNDGYNDYILPRGWGIKEILEFTIYNKWGEIVYEYKNDANGWNGTYKGKPQEPDTYVYFVKIRTFEDEIMKEKGTLNLMR